MYKEKIEEAKSKMEKTLVALKKDFSTLRAGRANPQILDKITVDYYGTPISLSGVANISSPEPRMLVISPWEAKMIGPIEKEIQKSDLGINPSNDGRVIRLVVPELTEERRKDLCKQVKKAAEESKVNGLIALGIGDAYTRTHVDKLKLSTQCLLEAAGKLEHLFVVARYQRPVKLLTA